MTILRLVRTRVRVEDETLRARLEGELRLKARQIADLKSELRRVAATSTALFGSIAAQMATTAGDVGASFDWP